MVHQSAREVPKPVRSITGVHAELDELGALALERTVPCERAAMIPRGEPVARVLIGEERRVTDERRPKPTEADDEQNEQERAQRARWGARAGASSRIERH